jgi:N-acetylglucosaminyldiphosphoundecaprenol N-acetyl-beta-D-mannosaminyltransferase
MVAKRIRILDIPIDRVTRSETMRRITDFVSSKLPNQVATINPEFIMAASHNPEFRNALQASELNVPDGSGIRAAASFLHLHRPNWQPAKFIVGLLQGIYVAICVLFALPLTKQLFPETVTGIDLLIQICYEATKNSWRIYLVGGEPGVAEATARELEKKYPKLIIVGAEEGLTKSSTPHDTDKLIQRINNAKPDILFVAFGAPKQDLFIANNKQALGVPVMMGVGGSFDFIIGRAHRSPGWLRQIGLEWVWRLMTQPWRWQRIITATIRFPWSVYRSAVDF